MKKLLTLLLALTLALSVPVSAAQSGQNGSARSCSAARNNTVCSLRTVLNRGCGNSANFNTILGALCGSGEMQDLIKQLLANHCPQKPQTPAEPETPTPQEPANPQEPSKPQEPSNPQEPSEPEKPSDPQEPSNPQEPDTQPDTPATPPVDSRYTLANGKPITTENIQAILYGLKTEYPEGRRWTNANSYYCAALNTMGYGCAAYAFLCSDAVFGSLPVRGTHSNFDQVRVGDILRINNNSHSVVVLEVGENSVTVTEGNYNSSIHWGRTLSRQSLENGHFVATTRYPG